MRNVTSIVIPLAGIVERKVKAIQRINSVPRQHDHEHPVDTEHLPQSAAYPNERRKAQRRISNQPTLMDRRTDHERRHYYLFRHINEEA